MSSQRKQEQEFKDVPNPREWMRARHPELYSDSQVSEVIQLSKLEFEYFLDTLTNRKEEYKFEHFCRKLAEKEICPNLRVQTGPTGGGDSKVDSETYPVSDDISERWWIGTPSAGSERWGFAFSAKKAWKPKAKSDVANILSTGRDYKHIYFFTNQFVSDKERAAEEDKLSRSANVPVHIVDRAWIVEKVYDNNHLGLAISALGIEGVKLDKKANSGPRDTALLSELEELDSQIKEPDRYIGIRYQLAEDCLRGAILARTLEHPRHEVEGRFAQADRLSKELNIRQQRLRIAYNRGWTAFWWYEDYTSFNEFYNEVEQLLEGSTTAGDVELLCNLWQLLIPAIGSGRISPESAKMEVRRKRLVSMLESIACDSSRPNNALEARTNIVLLNIARNHIENNSLDSTWDDLSQIVDDSKSLVSYPIERLYRMISELGNMVESPSFDILYDKLVQTILSLRSNGEAGEAYVERGFQKLKLNKPYEAIKWFGKAEELLMKIEFRSHLVKALIASSFAYESVGLYWAARNKAMAAIERCFAVFNTEGEMVPPALHALQRLVWVELQIGRLPHILNAMKLANFVARSLKLSDSKMTAFKDEQWNQQAILGIHFLNTSLNSLKKLINLPEILEHMGLDVARMALLYALGHEQTLREEGFIPQNEDSSAVNKFFEQWQDQQASLDIQRQPILVHGPTSQLKSVILGVELYVTTPNTKTSFGIAESFLGALEALLATSTDQEIMPHREKIEIDIRPASLLEGSPKTKFSDDGSQVKILHPYEIQFNNASDYKEYSDWLKNSIIEILPQIMILRDADSWSERMANQENAFARSLLLGDALTLDRNVFGDDSPFLIDDFKEPGARAWELTRERTWRAYTPGNMAETREPVGPPKFGHGKMPEGLLDKEKIKHTELRVLSPINVPLWNKAAWQATLFGWNPQDPPLLALGFKNGIAGQAIFRAWQEQWGVEDVNDVLRIAIITGLSSRKPAEYAVIVGPNLSYSRDHDTKMIYIISRINRMTPANSVNLKSFIAAFQKTGTFLFAPADLSTGTPIPFMELGITKHHVHIREAWQISENDPDSSALDPDEDPIIPPGVVDPPVTLALQHLRASRKAHQGNR